MGALKKLTGVLYIGMSIGWFLISILYAVIHIWTIGIVYQVSGLIGAIISGVIPVLPMIHLFLKIGFNVGFDNYYCLAVMALVGLFIVVSITFIIFTFAIDDT